MPNSTQFSLYNTGCTLECSLHFTKLAMFFSTVYHLQCRLYFTVPFTLYNTGCVSQHHLFLIIKFSFHNTRFTSQHTLHFTKQLLICNAVLTFQYVILYCTIYTIVYSLDFTDYAIQVSLYTERYILDTGYSLQNRLCFKKQLLLYDKASFKNWSHYTVKCILLNTVYT